MCSARQDTLDPNLRSGREENDEPALGQAEEGRDERLEEQEYRDPRVPGSEAEVDESAEEEDRSAAWVAGLDERADAAVDTGPYHR